MSATTTDLPPTGRIIPNDLPPLDSLPPLPPLGDDDRGKGEKRRGRPRGSGRPGPAKSLPKKEPSDADVTRVVAELLSMTAVIHTLPQLPEWRCDYCRDAILTESPGVARELVELSKEHEMLRGALVGITRFFTGMSVMSSLGKLYGRSMIHHGPDVPVMSSMGHVMYPDMPDRPVREAKLKGGRKHAHSPASAGTMPGTNGGMPGMSGVNDGSTVEFTADTDG